MVRVVAGRAANRGPRHARGTALGRASNAVIDSVINLPRPI